MARNEGTFLFGRLGADAELRTLASGQQVMNLRVAVDRSYSDKSGKRVEATHWQPVAVWGATEAQANIFRKGCSIHAEGRMDLGKPYQNGDGEWVSTMTLNCGSGGIRFLSAPRGAQAQPVQNLEVPLPGQAEAATDGGFENDDEIPF